MVNSNVVQELISDLERLSTSLTALGKTGPAEFVKHQSNIMSTGAPDQQVGALNELYTCGAIAQYAGFTVDQENQLDRIVILSKQLLEEI